MTNQSPRTLPIGDLQPNPLQPREQIKKEQIEELVDSIKQFGILEPLVVAHTPAGYQIIAGERRWRAAKEVGLKEVPVHLIETTRKGMLEMALVENVQRKDLNPIERAQAFKRLTNEFNITPTQIAQKISKSPSYVTNSISLLKLPDAIKDGMVGGLISEGHARALGQIKDPSMAIECYKILLKEEGSVRRAEQLARRYRNQINKAKVGEKFSAALDDRVMFEEKIPTWESNLQERLTNKLKLNLARSAKQTAITIIIKGDPFQTQRDVEELMKSIAEKNA